jgi:hypothetical protein
VNGKEAGRMKNTLQTLAVLLTAIVVFGCSREVPPEEKALRLAEESQVLGGNQSVKLTLNNWLEERGEEIKPIGWGVSKKHDQVYMVSYKYKIYSFKKGTGERGFFFEVDLGSGSVRNVTKEVMQKMGSLSPSFRGEEEISEQLMKKLGEDEKMVSGDQARQPPPTSK